MRAIRAALMAATLLTPFAASAAIDPAPVPGSNDTRLRTVDRSLVGVVNLTSTNLTPINLSFPPGETIINVSGLFVVPFHAKENATVDEIQKASAACVGRGAVKPPEPVWCVNWTASEVSLQPIHDDSGSMFMITTQAAGGGALHDYNYHLSTRKGAIGGAEPCAPGQTHDCYDRLSYFHVQYTDKVGERARAIAEAKPMAIARQERKVSERILTDTSNAPRFYRNWFVNDSPACHDLAPDTIFDDGRQTYIHFTMNTPLSIPTLPPLDGKGQEVKANFTDDQAPDGGRKWTLNNVPRVIYLRRGVTNKEVCGLYNKAWNRDTTATFTGTSSPNVVREIR